MTIASGTARHGGLLLRSAAGTHPGLVRRLNEDNLLERPDAGLWVVADGMGGHQRGDLASAAIVQALDLVEPPEDAPGFMAQVRARLEAVNAELRGRWHAHGETTASTIVCLLVFQRNFACVWAGDSRLYLLRGGQLYQVSTDHSVVQELVAAGALDPAQAAHHPRANEVTRAVGAFDELPLEIRQSRLQPGDTFLLCSDGLCKVADDAEIAADLLAHDPQGAVAALVGRVLDRGAPDNVTVVVVRCEDDPEGGEEQDTLVLKRRPASIPSDPPDSELCAEESAP